MLFGSGIELGIGIDTQPDIDTTANANNAKRIAVFTLFFNFKDSPVNLNYMAQYQGFSKGFPGLP
jgi:hypothetical protein